MSCVFRIMRRQFQLLTQPSHIFNLLFDSRAMKLWNLRYMRKRIHKHLCKALARKVKYLLNHCRIVVCSFWGFFSILLVFYAISCQAKKRRFLEKWICFVKLQKQSRGEFIKILQIVHIRTFFKCWRNETTGRIQMR
jgi:hypothetical protein